MLATDSQTRGQPEPNLYVPELLYIDGQHINYDLVQWDFQPNQDIHVEDTGFGVVRIAWPELEASGVLSFTLDFVPQSDLQALLTLLLTPKQVRWLSFRGRRYRVYGFTPTYRPIPSNPDYYRIEVNCVAYRPHKSLPPVPGTEIYPVADVRRYGGMSNKDRIIYVGGWDSWLVVFLTSGITLWNTDNGQRYTYNTNISSAGLVSRSDNVTYVVWGNGNATFMKACSENGFIPGYLTVPVPFSLQTHLLLGDTLTFIDGGVLKKLSFYQATVENIPNAEAGLKINPLGVPTFFTEASSTNYPSTWCAVPSDTLGISPVGEAKALVFRPSGVYLYSRNGNKLINSLRTLDTTNNLVRFGVIGMTGYPEGYWLKEADTIVMEEYVPVGDPYAPGLVDSDGDGWLEAPIIYRTAWIRSAYSDVLVRWGALEGLYYDGQLFYPYTDQHIFTVTPLL